MFQKCVLYVHVYMCVLTCACLNTLATGIERDTQKQQKTQKDLELELRD